MTFLFPKMFIKIIYKVSLTSTVAAKTNLLLFNLIKSFNNK